MRDLIIGKNVAYALSTATGVIAGSWASDLLTDGAIAIVDDTGTIVAHDAANLTGIPYVNLLTKSGTLSKTSFPLYAGKTKYSKQAYVAPVAKVMALGSEEASAAGNNSLNLPATLSVGDVIGIGVVNLSLPVENTSRYKEYTVTAVSGDLLTGNGSSNIITKLVAKINADANRIVEAVAHEDGSDNNDGIKFTSKTAGQVFGLYHVDGILKDADISIITDVTLGSGTVADILALHKATKSRDGDNSYRTDNDIMFSGASQIVAGTTYTTYVFTTEVPNTDAISQSNKPPMELVIAVPSGSSAVIAAIDNLGAIIV